MENRERFTYRRVRMYQTHMARMSAINDIRRKIDALGSVKNSDLGYIEYRGIINYLSMLIDQIYAEDKEASMESHRVEE